jgi:glycyl-tRNA synthetase
MPDGVKILPEVIEPSVGVDRLFYAIACEKYSVEKVGEEDRIVFHLPFSLAPYKFCILPLSNKLNEAAKSIYKIIADMGVSCAFDESGSIGKRYRRQDAIGTPYCITYDFNSKENDSVTVRDRDSMQQEIIKLGDLKNFIISKIL